MAIRPPKNNISDPKTGGVTREWLAWLQEIADAAIPPTSTPPGTPPAANPPGGGGGGGGGGSDYGTGTPGFIAKWLAAHELGDSIISESGGVITINGDLIANSISGTYQPSDINTGGVANAFFLTDVTATAAFHTSVPFTIWPTVDNAFDLGQSGRAWRNGYFTGHVVIAATSGYASVDVSTTDPADVAYVRTSNGSFELRMTQYGAAFGGTYAGVSLDNLSLLESTGSHLMVAYDTGSCVFVNGTLAVARFHHSGGLSLNTTTDPGLGNVFLLGSGSNPTLTLQTNDDVAAILWKDDAGISRWQAYMPTGDELRIRDVAHALDILVLTPNVGLGVGVTPTERFQVETSTSNGFKFRESFPGGYYTTFQIDFEGLKIGHNSFARDIQFQIGSVTKATISTNGNLGIGTTTFPVTGTAAAIFADGTAPATMGANTAGIYAEDVSGTVKMFVIDEAGAFGQIAVVGGSGGSLTPGSVVFAGATGQLAQDNANLFWDDANNRLGIGTNAPGVALQVTGKIGINHTGLGGNALDVFSSATGTLAAFQHNGAVNGNTIISMNTSATGSIYAVAASISCTNDAIIEMQQNGTGRAVFDAFTLGAGDVLVKLRINGGADWSLGIDNSDSDKFKIASSNVLGTASDYLTIDMTGNLRLNAYGAGVLTTDASGNVTAAAATGVSGSGTTGKVPKWSSSSALTDSIMTEASAVVTVGGDFQVNTNGQAVLFSSRDAASSGGGRNIWIGGGGVNVTGGTTDWGSWNTAVGYSAMLNLTSGRLNTAVGYQALRSETVGTFNTVLGFQAAYSSVNGHYEVAVGARALFSNIGGQGNVAVGMDALFSATGSVNTAIGYHALFATTTPNRNTAVGGVALTSNQTGAENVAVGYEALFTTVAADRLTAVGHGALYYSTGADNTGVGHSVLQNVTTGIQNTALGRRSGLGITTGSYNTIIGANVTGLPAGLSNTIILADGQGNQRLYIDSSGNVGIGTTSPSWPLHVASAGSNRVLVETTGGGALAGFQLKTPTSSWYLDNRGGADAPNDRLALYNPGATEVVTVLTSGNVGIGTSSPGVKLDVTGSIQASGQFLAANGSAAAPSYSFASATATGWYWRALIMEASIAGAPVLQINSGGLVNGGTSGYAFAGGSVVSVSPDLYLLRDAANTLAQRNGSAEQTFRLGPTALGGSLAGNSAGRLLVSAVGNLQFQSSSTNRWYMETGGSFIPNDDNLYDIGTALLRVRNLYLAGTLAWGGGSAIASSSNVALLNAANVFTASQTITAAVADFALNRTGGGAGTNVAIIFQTAGGAKSYIGRGVYTVEDTFLEIGGAAALGIAVHDSGGVSIGSTTDPGAANLSVNGTLVVNGTNVAAGASTADTVFNVYGVNKGMAFGGANTVGYIEAINGVSAAIRYDASLYHAWRTGSTPTERMRLDGSGILTLTRNNSHLKLAGASIEAVLDVNGSTLRLADWTTGVKGIAIDLSTGLLTFGGGGTHKFEAAVAGGQILQVTNQSAGGVQYAQVEVNAGTTSGQFIAFANGYANSGPFIASSVMLYTAAGNGLALVSASGEIRFYSSTGVLKGTFSTTSNIGLKLETANPLNMPSVDSSTGTALIIDGSGYVYKQTSAARYKEHIELLAPSRDVLTSFLQLAPRHWDYIGRQTGAVGLLADDLDAIPLRNAYGRSPLVNYDREGRPESTRDFAVTALHHLALQDHDARLTALEQQLTKEAHD